jgi:hypothetical protein
MPFPAGSTVWAALRRSCTPTAEGAIGLIVPACEALRKTAVVAGSRERVSGAKLTLQMVGLR